MLDRTALERTLAVAGPSPTSNASTIAVQLGVVNLRNPTPPPQALCVSAEVKQKTSETMNQPTKPPLASPSASF